MRLQWRWNPQRWMAGWLVGLVVGIFGIFSLGCPAAIASVHIYPEGNDQVMYRSLQTLRDRTNRAWQLVLFKRVKAGQTDSIHLRLVGFPGLVELQHPHPLQITTGTEEVYTAPDLLPTATFTPNVGEYDVQGVMQQLDANTPLRLALPTQKREVELLVPPFVVEEWRSVTAQS